MVASLKALPTLYEKVVCDVGSLGNRSRAAINLVEVIAESFGLKENRWTRPRWTIDLGTSGSHQTPRWREMDSNFRFRAKGATDLSFRFCLCP
jgi:hypothetical protein